MVTCISPVAEFTPRDIQTKDERVKLVYAVRIEIANPREMFKPGMPADAAARQAGGPRPVKRVRGEAAAAAVEISASRRATAHVHAVRGLDLRIEAGRDVRPGRTRRSGQDDDHPPAVRDPEAGRRGASRIFGHDAATRTSRGSRARSATSPSASASTGTSRWTRTSSSSPASTACGTSRSAVRSCSSFTRLLPFRRRLAERLSGGMKQKLALACTLVHRPAHDPPGRAHDGRGPGFAAGVLDHPQRAPQRGNHDRDVDPVPGRGGEGQPGSGSCRTGRLMAVGASRQISAAMRGAVLEIVCADTRQARSVLRLSGAFARCSSSVTD